MKNAKLPIRHLLLFVILAPLLQACLGSTRVDEMAVTAAEQAYPPAYQNNVSAKAMSSNTTRFAAWTPEVTQQNFSKALIKSLQTQQLYSEAGNYQLTADVLDIVQPIAGIEMTVGFKVRYELLDTESGVKVMDEVVESSHTATFSEDVIGEMRLRDAAEQSARENIAQMLSRLAALQ